MLVLHFLKYYAATVGKNFKGIPKREMDKLMQHIWPGNVRELEGLVERGTIVSHESHFRFPELSAECPDFSDMKYDSTLEGIERAHILQTLQKTGWKVRGPGGAPRSLASIILPCVSE